MGNCIYIYIHMNVCIYIYIYIYIYIIYMSNFPVLFLKIPNYKLIIVVIIYWHLKYISHIHGFSSYIF